MNGKYSSSRDHKKCYLSLLKIYGMIPRKYFSRNTEDFFDFDKTKINIEFSLGKQENNIENT